MPTCLPRLCCGCSPLLSCGSMSAAGAARSSSTPTAPTPRRALRGRPRSIASQRENPDVTGRAQRLRPRELQEGDPQLADGAPPDVVFWFAGNRMRQFVAPGLLEDVSDLYHRRGTAAHASVGDRPRERRRPPVRRALHVLPDRLLLSPRRAATPPASPSAPRTLARSRRRVRAARRRGHRAFRDRHPRPVARGRMVRLPRPARKRPRVPHGADARRASPTPIRACAPCFERWRELVDRDCFSRNHASSSWQESQALLYQGKAAMMLIGNYIVAQLSRGRARPHGVRRASRRCARTSAASRKRR